MCGIAAVWRFQADDPTAEKALPAMMARLAPRGPDGEGSLSPAPGLVLGHRRLAIIDPDPRANQPMASSDGAHVIAYNGEIYNFRELREELAAAGTGFRTESDTEVLLELYRRRGVGMLARLKGMYAFVLWDGRARTVLLARDPYGIKPLYYALGPKGLVVASQAKAVLASGLVAPDVDPAGVLGFHLTGSVPEPATWWRDIRPVAPGAWVEVSNSGAMRSGRSCDIRHFWRPRGEGEGEPASAAVPAAVRESVRRHLVSDVPVGAFLSGGIDSGVVAAAMSDEGLDVTGVTVAFSEYGGTQHDEVDGARATAALYGLHHHVRMVGFEEFEEDLPRILDAMDQPSIDGVNTWFASKAAAELGFKVVLSGIGGDELFRGYGTFREAPFLRRLARVGAGLPWGSALVRGALALRRGAPARFATLIDVAGSLDGAYRLRRGLISVPEASAFLPGALVMEGLARLGLDRKGAPVQPADLPTDPQAAVGVLESTRYLRNQLLRDSDWASMAHSLELRTPLADTTLASRLAPLSAAFSGGAGKRLLAATPTRGLPNQVVYGRKTGFGIPLDAWLRRSAHGDDVELAEGQGWAKPWARIVSSRFGVAA